MAIFFRFRFTSSRTLIYTIQIFRYLHGKEIEYFQRDDASAHSRVVTKYLNRNYRDSWILERQRVFSSRY